MARIKAVTRRANQSSQTMEKMEVIETNHFKINKETREVFLDGDIIPESNAKGV